MLTVGLDFARMPHDKDRRPAIQRDLLARLSSVPGVVSAAQVGFTPISGSGWNNDIGPDGTTAAASGKEANFNRVGPGYFRTMRTGLLAGREFDQRDTASSLQGGHRQRGASPASTSARPTWWAAPSAWRRRPGKPEPLFEIVGVVRNTKYRQLREDFTPIGFFPFAQEEEPDPGAQLRAAACRAPRAR